MYIVRSLCGAKKGRLGIEVVKNLIAQDAARYEDFILEGGDNQPIRGVTITRNGQSHNGTQSGYVHSPEERVELSLEIGDVLIPEKFDKELWAPK